LRVCRHPVVFKSYYLVNIDAAPGALFASEAAPAATVTGEPPCSQGGEEGCARRLPPTTNLVNVNLGDELRRRCTLYLHLESASTWIDTCSHRLFSVTAIDHNLIPSHPQTYHHGGRNEHLGTKSFPPSLPPANPSTRRSIGIQGCLHRSKADLQFEAAISAHQRRLGRMLLRLRLWKHWRHPHLAFV
jgi:hypothetical protein